MAAPPEPPASWAELALRLEALLGLFKLPCSNADLVRTDAAGWYAGVRTLLGGGRLPAAADREALARSVQQEGGCMVALNGQLLTATPGAQPSQLAVLPAVAGSLVGAASLVLNGSAQLADACPLPLHTAQHLGQAAPLLLDSGSMVLEALLAPSAAGAAAGVQAADSAAQGALQTGAVSAILMLLLQRADEHDVADFMGSVAPPQRVLRWLSAAAGVFEAAALARRPASGLLEQLAPLASLLRTVATHRAFRAHQLVLGKNAALAARLARLLAPAMAAASVALQLPEERRPPSCTWEFAADVAAYLAADCHLRGPALAEGGANSAAARALQAAAQLLVAAEVGGTAGCGSFFAQLQGALAIRCGQALMFQLPQQPAAQLARQLLETVPALTASLQRQAPVAPQGIAAVGSPHQFSCSCTCLSKTAELLADELMSGNMQLTSTEDVPVLCGAATAALRTLPLLQAAAARTLQPPSGGAVAAVPPAIVSLVVAACPVCLHVMAEELASTPAASGDAASAQAALAAMWQLHSALCRAVHWAAVGPAAYTAALGGPANVAFLVSAAALLLNAVYVGLPLLGGSADAARQMAAMCAAHYWLLRTAAQLEASVWQSQGSCLQPVAHTVLVSLLLVVGQGPAAPVAAPETPGLFTWLAQLLLQDEDDWHGILKDAMVVAGSSSPAFAHLVLSGFPGSVLGAAQSSPESAEVLRTLLRVTHSVEVLLSTSLEALEAGQQSDAAEERQLAAAMEQPAAALQEATLTLRASSQAQLSRALAELLPLARQLAAALLDWWRRPAARQANALALARAAAARSCAYLHCANLAGEGGPAAGQGAGSLKCSACCAVWYCNEACSHADWRGPGGHRRMCRALGAERAAARAAAGRPGQAAEAGGA